MVKKIVFMGSPEFAVPSLQNLAKEYHIIGVVTQPDKPAGRGRKLTPPPVKLLAQSLGLPIMQPQNLKDENTFGQIKEWMPDCIVVVAFGQILRENVLGLPEFGCINVHGSLLPRWRGAAPVQASILSGDLETGVTIMKMDKGVDTGPILSQRRVPLFPDDTAGSLSDRLAVQGADLLLDTLQAYFNGEITPKPQDEQRSTYAGQIKKEMGELNFEQPVDFLERKIRAYFPWPGTFFQFNGLRIKVLKAHIVNEASAIPGDRKIIDGLPAIGAASGYLILEEIQPAGKKAVHGDAFLRGARNWVN